MAREFEERTPVPGELTYTPRTLAEAVGKTRQAIDKAIRDGRIPAYRYPESTRLWLPEAELPATYRTTAVDLRTRLEALEATVEHLNEADSSTSTSGTRLHDEGAVGSLVAAELARLRAENLTLRAVNQLLLAEAAEQQLYDQARDEVFDLLREATDKQHQALKSEKERRAHYREALAQFQLPANIDDI